MRIIPGILKVTREILSRLIIKKAVNFLKVGSLFQFTVNKEIAWILIAFFINLATLSGIEFSQVYQANI